MLKLLSFMLCTFKIHPFSLGNYLEISLIIGNLVIIMVTNVEGPGLGTNHAQDFDLDIDLHSVGVDDVAPPTVKLGDAESSRIIVV